MNLVLKKSKKLFISAVTLALLTIMSLGLFLFNRNSKNVYASEFTVEDSVSVSNNNFTNYDTAGGSPYTPNNYTFSQTTGVTHGVINISESSFKENAEAYGLNETDNPNKAQSSYDNYILMISSKNNSYECGYTSNSFKFAQNGHYYVSVNVYTDNVDGSSSLYLFDKKGNVFAELPSINTHKTWQKYYFFISTNDYEDVELSLGLWLGSKTSSAKSYVFFDQISAGKISKQVLTQAIGDSSVDGKTVKLNEGGNANYNNFAGENVIDNNANFAVLTNVESSNSNYQETFMEVQGKLENVLEINNTKENSVTFESKEFELASNRVYKFSILAKAENITSGSAFIKLVEVADENAKNSDVLTFTSTHNKFINNYQEYSILVNSDPLEAKKVKLVLGLGETASSKAVGSVKFTNFELRSVPYSEFEASDSNSKKLDFSSDYKDNQTVKNFAFNFTSYDEVSTAKQKVTQAKNWTVVKSDKGFNQVAGVFNVRDFDNLDKTNLSNIANPGFINEFNSRTNNVFMLHNENTDVLTASSADITLTKNSYYKLSVWAHTQINSSNQAGAFVRLKTTDGLVLAEENINTNGQWQEFTYYIKTGFDSVSANLILSLGKEGSTSNGYAFFDNCLILSSNETAFNAVAENRIDLTNPISSKENGKPDFFEGKSKNEYDVNMKVLNLNEDISYDIAGEDRDAVKEYKGTNKNVLMISNILDDDFYTLTSKLNFNLTSGKYYKLTVDVYTGYMATDATNGKVGAGLKLSTITDAQFLNIETDREWKTYTFLVSPDKDVTTQISLCLGDEENECRGLALFGGINFEEITDKETYLDLVNNADDKTKSVGEVATDDNDENTDNEPSNDINWVLLTSTLTAVAVIVVVLVLGFKKLFKTDKKKVKKSKVEYDRRDTVIHQKYRRLAYLKREKDIRKNEKEIEAITTIRHEKEEKYKQLLNKIRELKLHNRDGKLNSEINNLNKALASSSKESAKLGVNINKLNNEIAFMKTEGYLQQLEKKLQKEDAELKLRGSSIEEVLKEEDNIVIEDNDSVEQAIEKAENLIARSEKEEELRIAEEERKAQEAEKARLEMEAKLEAERLANEKLEAEKQENMNLENETHIEDTTNSETNEQSIDEKEIKDENSLENADDLNNQNNSIEDNNSSSDEQ